MKPSHCLCLLFLASILVASSATVTVSPNKETAWEKKAWNARAPVQLADEAFLARLCDREQQHGRPLRILSWCTQLHARRQGAHKHHLPMPPPSSRGRDDEAEQIDPRYGVSKRLVPSGPNRLHN